MTGCVQLVQGESEAADIFAKDFEAIGVLARRPLASNLLHAADEAQRHIND